MGSNPFKRLASPRRPLNCCNAAFLHATPFPSQNFHHRTATYCLQPYDGVKVDVFSVGCMGFMMLTGIPPFDEATRLDPKFRMVVFRGDLQGYLRACGRPLLSEPVRGDNIALSPPVEHASFLCGSGSLNGVGRCG